MRGFSENFRSWMNLANGEGGAKYLESDERRRSIYFVTNSGELVYSFEELPGAWVRLSKSERGSTPDMLFDFSGMEGAETYLCVQYANMAREAMGLGVSREERLDPRERHGQASGRFSCRIVAWRGPEIADGPWRMRVFSADGVEYFRDQYPMEDLVLGPRDWDPAASLTWYADRPLEEVLDALRHPTGGDLFELLGNGRA